MDTRLMGTIAALAAILLVAGLFAFGGPAGASPGGMDAILIDMDPSGTPANSATSLGSNETCARINENGTLDADEDATADTLTIDVTATNIPADNAMIGFTYYLYYSETALTLQSENYSFMLAANSGSSVLAFNDPLPDTDGNGHWIASLLDTSVGTPETGSGVLDRLTISSDAGVSAGVYALSLGSAVHLDGPAVNPFANNVNWDSDADTVIDGIQNVASIAIDQACPGATPVPTPIATPTPTSAPTPTPTTPTATPSGSPTPVPTGPTDTPGPTPTPPPETPAPTPGDIPEGDVNCDGDVDTVDALMILRHVAGLPVHLPPGCPEVGS